MERIPMSTSNNNTQCTRPAAARRSMSVRALRRLTKAEALSQLVERPDLAANISAAARLWGVSRATVRAWLAEYAAMAVPPATMAVPRKPPPAALVTPIAAAEAVKAALSALCDSLEVITP